MNSYGNEPDGEHAADAWLGVVWSPEWLARAPDESGAPGPAGAPAGGQLAITPAVRGRPGGPGFEPGPAGSAAGRSPWQRSRWLWSESGVRWELPPLGPQPPLVPQPRPAGGWRSQARYQGRHARPRRLPARPAVPLGAPVVQSQDLDRGQAYAQVPAGALPPGLADHGAWRLRGRRGIVIVALPAAVLATVAVVATGLLTGRGPTFSQAAAHRAVSGAAHRAVSKATAPRGPRTIGMYSGQQGRGVFQRIDRIAGYRDTIVTTGSQSSDGQVRQQFFVSADRGASWRLAPVRTPGGGLPPLGHAATWIAGGPAGWLAVGPAAIWTSRDGLSWTLAAAHAMTPRPGDQVRALTATASGFLAGGATEAPGGGTQGAVWLSPDGVSWRQLTAARLGMAPGETVRDISAAAARGPDTVISGTVVRGAATYAGVWLSTDGGSSWTRVIVPADHGAAGGIVGLGSDAAGFLAVRPGRVAYFSPDGRHWRYAGTIGPAGGWSPTAVGGGSGGFAVTGRTAAGTIVAYTGTGEGAAWTPTGSLGAAAAGPGQFSTAAVGPGQFSTAAVGPGQSGAVAESQSGTVVAAGSAGASGVGQQGLLLEADRAGNVRSVPLSSIPGAVVPELAVNGMAAAGGVQVAVGSADGYPAIWRRQDGGSWTLVSSPALISGQDRLAALTGVARGPAGWLAVGVPGPLVLTSADGLTWHPAPGGIARDLGAVSAAEVAAGPAGYVIDGALGGRVADVWWSPDLTSWRRAGGMNDGQVRAVAADTHGFVLAGSHDGRPAVWATVNGRSWTTIVLPMPARASSAVLQQVAIDGNRVAALGLATTRDGVVPFAALSVSGGASWRQVPFASPGPGTAFTALIAGSRGFIAVGQYGSPGQTSPAAWTSAGGTAWVRSPLSGLTSAYHIAALAPAGPAAIAIGSIATQQSQGAFMAGVPAP